MDNNTDSCLSLLLSLFKGVDGPGRRREVLEASLGGPRWELSCCFGMFRVKTIEGKSFGFAYGGCYCARGCAAARPGRSTSAITIERGLRLEFRV